MSYIYSVEKEDSTFFKDNINTNIEITLYSYKVKEHEKMKISLISKSIYGTERYSEELMRINNIINPYNIKANQEIKYCSAEDMEKLYIDDIDYESYINKDKSEYNNVDNIINDKVELDPTTKQGESTYIIDKVTNSIKIITQY